ncbi:hypothetical protein CORT_0D02920 [Candida orthopsilosis Co 90-125]|uniref:Uncharacterized protein n=1 Tax=Candida orthopsilosis (strain 90-125) TaxID=1136231 RepID=H8X544_CANO9|nr:hypothetical protein CORT_0D02920 [Candida orthopsilosis Co 90-125]CCG23137.1 hypothetical protein CORT_0D02920 [Candida orthopsilosis Co 90-125]
MPQTKIPGYYFDESRGRYFKITNGAVPAGGDTTQKYHNNAVQAEKRSQHFERVEKQDQNKHDKPINKKRRGQDVIKNPHVNPYRSSNKLDQRLRKVEWDHLSMLSMKAGAINLKSGYFNNDMVDAIRCGMKLKMNEIIPPQGKIVAYHENYFVMSRFLDDGCGSMLNLAVFTNSGNLYVPPQSIYCATNGGCENLTRDLAKCLFDPYGRNPVNPCIYAGYDSAESTSNILQVYSFCGEKYCTVVKFHTFCSDYNSFEDLTVPLMKFLKSQFNKLHKKGRKLSKAFGLNTFEFVGSTKTSIDEINAVLRSGARASHARARLDSFLNTHDSEKPNYIYRPTKDYTLCIIEDCTIVGGQAVAVTSDGQIVYFEWNHRLKRFQEFKLFTTQLPMPNASVKLLGDFVYVSTSNDILIINYKEKQIERHKFEKLRKFFILSPTQWIVINQSQIRYYDPSSRESSLIMSYNNGNDARQQFEIVNNHLIFNLGNKFKVINLCRATKDQHALLELDFDTYKYGHFKHFKLDRIIDMGVKDGRTVVGFQFANDGKTHTRFESYYI